MQEGAGPRPYDVATRRLIEGDPAGWLRWIGLPANGPVQPIDSDLGTVLAEVDKVLRVAGPSPWIAHLELQASRDPQLPTRMSQYNALLVHRHQVVVESTIVLLRPDADGPTLTGLFEQHGPSGYRTVSFGYHVIRLWQRPVEELLSGELGVVPLAPLAAVDRSNLMDVVRRADRRLRDEAVPTVAGELRSAMFLLMGLRYDRSTREEARHHMGWLQESATYHEIREEGREEGRAQGRVAEARRLLLALGTEKLGAPGQPIVTALNSIEDLDRLERLHRRILTANSWADLLGDAPGS